jgi:uncharacterized SAM-binding protein YcdF (DUF218 family)
MIDSRFLLKGNTLDFLFILKKTISGFLMPLNALILLMLISVWLPSQWHAWQRPLLTSLCLLLALMCFSPFVRLTLIALESQYPAYQAQPRSDCVIHVLGHGHQEQEGMNALMQLSRTARARLLEGLQQVKAHQALGVSCALVVSGSKSAHNQQAHAQIMKKAARALGYTGKITTLDDARDTIEEAQAAKQAGQTALILVTSATHMPRAVMIFEREGLKVTPAPTDFVAATLQKKWFGVNNLSAFTEAWHEYLGILWYQLRAVLWFS